MAAGQQLPPIVRVVDAVAFFASVPPTQMKEGLQDLIDEMHAAGRSGFSDAEVSRAHASVLAHFERAATESLAGKEASATQVEEIMKHFLTGDAVPGRDMELALIREFAEEVGAADVSAYFSSWFSANDLIIASLSPGGAQPMTRADVLAMIKASRDQM